MAFLGSLLQYIITLIIMAVLGFAGAMAGRALRIRKDAKTAAEAGAETKE